MLWVASLVHRVELVRLESLYTNFLDINRLEEDMIKRIVIKSCHFNKNLALQNLLCMHNSRRSDEVAEI